MWRGHKAGARAAAGVGPSSWSCSSRARAFGGSQLLNSFGEHGRPAQRKTAAVVCVGIPDEGLCPKCSMLACCALLCRSRARWVTAYRSGMRITCAVCTCKGAD